MDVELEKLVRDVLAECTAALAISIERECKPGERKDLSREALHQWREAFDATVGKRLRKLAEESGVSAAAAAWGDASNGRGYVRRHVAKIARRAYLESGFGWEIDDQDIVEAVATVIEKADKTLERLSDGRAAILKAWCA